jgi:hypothetical protein
MNEVRVDIPYQAKHSRLSVLLRPILTIPVIVVMLLMIVPNHSFNPSRAVDATQEQVVEKRGKTSRHVVKAEPRYFDLTSIAAQGYDMVSEKVSYEALTANVTETTIYAYGSLLGAYLLFIPLVAFSLWFMYVVNTAVALTLLFRKKYPKWWFDWNQSLQAFVLRIYCYSLFLTDKYPSLEAEDSAIKLHLPNPISQDLSRVLPLVKWLLVLPYLAVYCVFFMVGLVLVPLTFMTILVTGRLPRWIYRFQVAVINFYLRIASYALLLVTDKFPKMIFRS